MEELLTLRSEIDELDELLIRLIKQRMIISKQIKLCKNKKEINVEDRKREEEILSKIDEIVNEEELSYYVKKLYETMFVLSKELQK